MSNQLLLSVIIPFLNASEDVEGLFSSIASQTDVDHKKIEIIVVNDGSADNTMEKVEQFKNLFKNFADFRILQHIKRKGLAQTRYDGATEARGKFLTFVDKKLRPDPDYFANLLNKGHNIVIGNVYMDKTRSPWDRIHIIIRKKLYYPYFNHAFRDIELNHDSYRSFKNKGGGGVMLVLRDYYLRVASTSKKDKNANDDSMLIANLAAIEPLLKTA